MTQPAFVAVVAPLPAVGATIDWRANGRGPERSGVVVVQVEAGDDVGSALRRRKIKIPSSEVQFKGECAGPCVVARQGVTEGRQRAGYYVVLPRMLLGAPAPGAR